MTSIDGRSQRPKPCADGCGRTTRGTHCMECFTKIPARERAGEFGKFELRPSHLITNSDTPPGITSQEMVDARLTVASLAVRNTGSDAEAVEVTRELLDMLGIAGRA
jgi:hypothetical protein